jgi:hypothetical protein
MPVKNPLRSAAAENWTEYDYLKNLFKIISLLKCPFGGFRGLQTLKKSKVPKLLA